MVGPIGEPTMYFGIDRKADRVYRAVAKNDVANRIVGAAKTVVIK
jgi:hypothetical protein